MSFLTSLALLVGLLAAAPVLAHLLRRKRATEIVLPTASLLVATAPTARRRSALEDRYLMLIRILAVILLAILGATPFVSCSHLALVRKDGASVAMVIVLDDSLSMRIKDEAGVSRFDRAKSAADDLLDGAQPGDSFAIVMAGRGARVQLASTNDVAAARAALAEASVSDRATDLDAALVIAKDILRGAPQPDKRVVLLSDLADGDPGGAVLDVGAELALWYPLPGLESKSAPDCAIVRAEQQGLAVDVEVHCSGGPLGARGIELLAASSHTTVVASAELVPGAESVSLRMPEGTAAELELDARLATGDAIVENDLAPVVKKTREMALGVVVDAAANRVETGGPPPVEQAFAALELGPLVRPLASVPEHAEELSSYAGIVLDDPPGLTPEERRSLAQWVEGGGVVLISLGRRAASAPLGAGFGNLIPGVVRWSSKAKHEANSNSCGFFGPSAAGLSDIAANGRTVLDQEALANAENLCAFIDGQPLLLRRTLGKGTVMLSTLPFDLQSSDLPLRPAFLVLLDRFAQLAHAGGGAHSVEAGQSFAFVGAQRVQGEVLPIGAKSSIRLEIAATAGPRVEAARIGRYKFVVDDKPETRFSLAAARETELRPRAVSPRALDPSLGGETRKLDASPYVAMGLLVLLLLEIVVRLLSPGGNPAPTPAAAEIKAAVTPAE